MSTRSIEQPNDKNVKRRKISTEPELSSPKTGISNTSSDVLDPVEKLLSFANRDDNFFSVEDNEPEQYESTPEPSTIKGMMDANMKLYYSQLHRRQNNDTSSFATLNQRKYDHYNQNNYTHSYTHNNNNSFNSNNAFNQVPFFRTVNFNPSSTSSTYKFDDYLSYPELEDDGSDSSDQQSSEEESVTTPTLKFNTLTHKNMSFHYRHNDNLNLSETASTQPETLDVFKAMNKTCILNGKASEMVSTGRLLINDFYL